MEIVNYPSETTLCEGAAIAVSRYEKAKIQL